MPSNYEQELVPIILCGGSGTRLWPLSRNSYPKQFVNLVENSKISLLQETIKRIEKFNNITEPIIVCNEEHRFLVAEQCKEINIKPPARNGSDMVSDGARDFLEHRDRKAKIERISRDIDRLEREKAQVRRKMDDALDRYQQQKSLANNNLAGATWEQALANEAEVMRQRYQSEIDELDDEITRLRDDQRRLVDQNE